MFVSFHLTNVLLFFFSLSLFADELLSWLMCVRVHICERG